MSTIAIDVDCTICDTGDWWLAYLWEKYRLTPEGESICNFNGVKPYNLSEMFQLNGDDPLKFFKSPTVYDGRSPRKDALEWIPKLKELGHKIVFVSRIIPEHALSKTNFLNKWFDHDGIIFTATKQYIKANIFIDDCYEVLNTLSDETLSIKFRLDYMEKIKPTRPYLIQFNWEQIYNHIRGLS